MWGASPPSPEFKALVTRTLHAVDESIRLQIEGIHDADTFATAVLKACQYGDFRTATHMRRLLEDSPYVQDLPLEDREAAFKAVALMFPLLPFPSGMPAGLKLEASKLTAVGEQVTVQAHDLGDLVQVNAAIDRLWALIDERLIIANGRQVAHEDYLKSLPYAQKLVISRLMDQLYGRMPRGPIASTVLSNGAEH